MLVSAGSAESATANQPEDQHHEEGGSMTTPFELPHGTPEEVGMSGKRLNQVRDVVQEVRDILLGLHAIRFQVAARDVAETLPVRLYASMARWAVGKDCKITFWNYSQSTISPMIL